MAVKNKKTLRNKRHPGNLAYNIASRIIKEDFFDNKKWHSSSLNEKIAVLNNAYKIMAEEACIPPRIIKNTLVYSAEYPENVQTHISADVNLIFNIDENNAFSSSKCVLIGMNEKELCSPFCSLEYILHILCHEVIHIMQHQCLCDGSDAFPYAEMQEEWKNDIMKIIKSNNTKDGSFSDYLSHPVEMYAYSQSMNFYAVLMGMKRETYTKNKGY